MLHPSLQSERISSELRARWQADPCIRIAPFLDDAVATSLLHELRPQALTLMATVSADLSFQYWSLPLQPENECDHITCRFVRWMWTQGTAWLSDITGLCLGPPEDRVAQATLYTKGCYLDVHNDYDGARQVAFVLGLSPEPIPEDAGGHLEFLHTENGRVQVTEQRAPGWNTLDIFDVRAPARLHRIPLVTRYVERRAITGWLYQGRDS